MTTKDEEMISTSDIAAAGHAERLARDHADQSAAPAVDGPRVVDDTSAPLFANEDAGGYRTRWSAIQTGFVDEPRKAVEEADTLVAEVMKHLAEVMKHLAEVFAGERRQLEAQWERADQVSTEDLRLVMRRYRSFFRALARDLKGHPPPA